MVDHKQITKSISLESYGIQNATVNYQWTARQLHDETIRKGLGVEASNGALAINTGEFTGRSPQDRFIVKDDITTDRVWWGDINKPFDAEHIRMIVRKAVNQIALTNENRFDSINIF